MQRSANAAGNGGRVRSSPARRPVSAPQQKRPAKLEASGHQSGGSRGSSTSAADTQVQPAWLFELPDAMRLLVQQPLLQLRSELHVEDEDSPRSPGSSKHGGNSLSCLSIFLRRILQALLELQQLVDASRPGHMPGVAAMMQWLATTREELCLWGQRAGRAVRALAGSSQKLRHEPKELGNQLHSLLQDTFMEALKQTSSRFDEELSQLREELQHSRSLTEVQEANDAVAATDAARWRRSLEEMLEEKFKDSKAADERNWHDLREEMARSKERVFSELAEQQNQNVKHFSELLASRDRQRERELQLLREHTETAMLEVKSSIGSVQMASQKARSEQQALAAAEARFTEQLQAERLAHNQMLVTEQREKGALALQLTEAMDAVSSKDRSIEHLQKSLGEIERARPEPVQTALSFPPRVPSLPSAGPIPPSPKAPVAEPIANLRSPGKLSERPHNIQLPNYADSSASVCRLSTESTSFQSKSQPPDPTSRRTVMDSAPCHGAGVPPRPADQQAAPWDLPPEEFLSMWRQSQASAAELSQRRFDARTNSKADRDIKPGLSPSASTDTLRITASWD